MRLNASLEPDPGSLVQAIEQSLGARHMLRPDPVLDTRMDAEFGAARGRQAAIATVAGMVLCDMLLLISARGLVESAESWLLPRLGALTVLGSAAAWWLWRRPSQPRRDGIQFAWLFAASACMAMPFATAPAGLAAYYAGMALPVMMAHLFSSLGFVAAVRALWFGLGGMVAGLVAGMASPADGLPVGVLAVNGLCWLSLLANARINSAERRADLARLREALHAEMEGDQSRALLELAHTDTLTGAANRRMFEAELEASWQGEPGGQVAVMLVDLDQFRRYNDRYGNPAGDRCLAAVAAIMQQQLRTDIDLLARYDGQCFGIVLPGTDPGDAAQIAERIRRAVQDLAIPHDGNPPRKLMTVSVGFAAGLRGPGRPDRLVEDARAALRAAKQAGRNRIAPPLAVSPERGGAPVLPDRRPRGPAA